MTTLPHTLLSEQDMRNALTSAGIACSDGFLDMLRPAMRVAESAVLAKLSEGVELEAYDQDLYVKVGKLDRYLRLAVPMAYLPTARAAVAAERMKSRDVQAKLWAEIHTLRAEIKGPDGYATWREAAVAMKMAALRPGSPFPSPAPAAEPVTYNRDDEGPEAAEAYASLLARLDANGRAKLVNHIAHGARATLAPDGGVVLTRPDWQEVRVLSATPSPQPTPAAEPVPQAVADVLAERRRQVEELGWTAHHDDEHANGELATAAAAYADPAPAMYRDPRIIAPLRFPTGWDYKPKDYRTNLVRAAALLVAEIERVDRGGPIPPHLLIYRERIRMSDARKAEIAREKAEFEADCARIPTPKDKP